MVFRLILPKRLQNQGLKLTHEGEFSSDRLEELNAQGYNVYNFPNYPSLYDPSRTVDGSQVDTFHWCFVDMDLKDGTYATKEDFLVALGQFPLTPCRIVDSGNGIHAYWRITDLDAKSYLRIQRRLCRLLNTDEAVSKLCQLMRYPGYFNTKNEGTFPVCETIFAHEDLTYTCEDLDKHLPPISQADEQYCQNHYNQTHRIDTGPKVSDALPTKFGDLLRTNAEVKDIWLGNTGDRSRADYRLGHIMWASGFSKDEALSVLVNSAKALERAPHHRVSYAQNIVDKIGNFEAPPTDTDLEMLSETVEQILSADPSDGLEGERIPCHTYLDATAKGFRLGHVIGLVAGSGVGKTAVAMNMVHGFVTANPQYEHFFVPLEQTKEEIAVRWKDLCGADTHLYKKLHILSNYNKDGTFRHLSLDEIQAYILRYESMTGKKVGCVIIDHIGALKKKSKEGENQGLMDICHAMKSFAITTSTLMVMQSQAPREKAGIGDLELNKDAAYGTVYFESYCDFLLTIWQPLKRCYSEPTCPSVTAFKFCKIRHKKRGKDKIEEDVCYKLLFDPKTERMRTLTQIEEKSFDYFLKKATNMRKLDRKTDIIPYQSVTWTDTVAEGSSQ